MITFLKVVWKEYKKVAIKKAIKTAEKVISKANENLVKLNEKLKEYEKAI